MILIMTTDDEQNRDDKNWYLHSIVLGVRGLNRGLVVGSLQKNNDNEDDDFGFLMMMTKNHCYLPPSAMALNIWCNPLLPKYQEENSGESPDVCFSASVVSRNGFSDVLQNFCKCKWQLWGGNHVGLLNFNSAPSPTQLWLCCIWPARFLKIFLHWVWKSDDHDASIFF